MPVGFLERLCTDDSLVSGLHELSKYCPDSYNILMFTCQTTRLLGEMEWTQQCSPVQSYRAWFQYQWTFIWDWSEPFRIWIFLTVADASSRAICTTTFALAALCIMPSKTETKLRKSLRTSSMILHTFPTPLTADGSGNAEADDSLHSKTPITFYNVHKSFIHVK